MERDSNLSHAKGARDFPIALRVTILIVSTVYPIDGTIAEKEDTMKRPRTINKPLRVIRSIDELPVICDAAEVGLLLRKKPETVSKMAHD